MIDSHDRPVDDVVWSLYRDVLTRTGPLPTLIEWDNDVPDWPILKREAEQADVILQLLGQQRLGLRHAS